MTFPPRHRLYLLSLLLSLCGSTARAQAVIASDKPIPDIAALMHQVEAHQKATEALVQNYLYHSHAIEQTLNGHGNLKKTQTEDSEIFWVAGTRIRRILSKDGQPLPPSEQEKESRRIDKEIAQAKSRQQKDTSPADDQRGIVTVSRFLELGSFSNPRRLTLQGRDTFAVDFTGNPKAKTHSSFEGALREMEGTVWVDEQDQSLRKLEGRFVNDFKVGGGLLADVRKGSSFQAEWTKVNDEVWLPSSAGGRGDVRVLLLLNIHGSLAVTNSAYRKFKATSTILPAAPAGSGP